MENNTKTVKNLYSSMGFVYLFGAALCIGFDIAGGILLKLLPRSIMGNSNIAFILSYSVRFLISYPIFVFLIRMIPKTQALPTLKLRFSKMLMFFAMAYGAGLIINFVTTIITMTVGLIRGSEVPNVLETFTENVDWWPELIVVVIVAPFFEELLFRKLLIDRAVKYGEGIALALSGVMFGLFHMNFQQAFYACGIGMIFAYVYIRTGKIVYSYILHMSVNALGVVALEIVKHVLSGDMLLELSSGNPEAVLAFMSSKLYIVVGLLFYYAVTYGIAITGFVLLLVKGKKMILRPCENQIPKGRKFGNVVLNPGMLCYIVFCLGMMVFKIFF